MIACFASAQVTFIAGPAIDADDLSGIDQAAVSAAAQNADLVVVCIGEETYTEKPGDINSLDIASGQSEVGLLVLIYLK